MFFKQIYLGCLAQASYVIGSDGEAAVVDPRRDVEDVSRRGPRAGPDDPPRDRDAPPRGFRVGPPGTGRENRRDDLLRREAGAAFPHVGVQEGDEIRMGPVTLRFLETPGHTPESVSMLVFDRVVSEVPQAVLTGDTLFIGDVGRPDLLGARMSAQELAGLLYDSLHDKLLALPDPVVVWPAPRRRVALRQQHLERARLRRSGSSGGSTTRCSRWARRNSWG